MLVHSEENNQEVLVQCEEEVGMNFEFSRFRKDISLLFANLLPNTSENLLDFSQP